MGNRAQDAIRDAPDNARVIIAWPNGDSVFSIAEFREAFETKPSKVALISEIIEQVEDELGTD